MLAVVTGAAGFIGSTLVDALLGRGDEVIGVDALTDYYEVSTKRTNLADALEHPSFTLVEADLSDCDPGMLLDGADVVFHLAAQPGVRASWGSNFSDYVRRNVQATQRLLEACRGRPLYRFVNSSSSSVYGKARRLPTSERELPAPASPYGVTKLAAEHLCGLYGIEFGVPTVSLRYFTVYGPRQRPDMAIHRLITAATEQRPFVLNGDGSQVRDFTYVDDAVSANLLAADAGIDAGTVLNVGGGASISVGDVVAVVERATHKRVPLKQTARIAGDPPATSADISLARDLLKWAPKVPIAQGIERQVEWQHEN